MALPVLDTTTDVDSSSTPESSSGPLVFIVSGTPGGSNKMPEVDVLASRNGSPYVTVGIHTGFGRFRAELLHGDDFYYTIKVNGCTVSLHAVLA